MSVAHEGNEGPSDSMQVAINEPGALATLNRWDCLPAVPLRMIYSLVPRTEQKHMSLVNKRWFEEFETPGNWTTLRFIFPTNAFTFPYLPSVKFALRYGRLVKHLEICCRRRCRLSFGKVIKQYEAFVKAIRERSQLQSLTVYNLKQIYSHIGKKYRARVVVGICKIFKTAKTIQSASFTLCSFNRKEMEMIFSQMFVKSSSPITKLQIKRMQRRLRIRLRVRRGDRFTPGNIQWIVRMFQRLEEWETDYREILERAINGFAGVTREELATIGSGRTGTLKLLTIRYQEWAFRGVTGITSTNWQKLREFCPDLKVQLTIGPTFDPRKSLRMLAPSSIPLRAFAFRISGRKHDCQQFKITEVFNHLTDNHLTAMLEDLTLIWSIPSPTLIEDLDHFIHACPVLKSVEIQIVYPLPLQNLFLLWTNSPPSFLQEVLFIVTKIPSEDEFKRMNLMAQPFISELNLMGINFTLNLIKSQEILEEAPQP